MHFGAKMDILPVRCCSQKLGTLVSSSSSSKLEVQIAIFQSERNIIMLNKTERLKIFKNKRNNFE